MEPYGVFVVPKPLSRAFFYQALRLIEASRRRLLGLRTENVKLQDRIEEIRLVDRVVAIINWSYILGDQFGIINIVLQGMGIIDKPILFLGDYALIRPTVILVSAWKQMPFMMITLLAADSAPLLLFLCSWPT